MTLLMLIRTITVNRGRTWDFWYEYQVGMVEFF